MNPKPELLPPFTLLREMQETPSSLGCQNGGYPTGVRTEKIPEICTQTHKPFSGSERKSSYAKNLFIFQIRLTGLFTCMKWNSVKGTVWELIYPSWGYTQADERIYLGSAGPQSFHISFNFQDLLEKGNHPNSFSSLG